MGQKTKLPNITRHVAQTMELICFESTLEVTMLPWIGSERSQVSMTCFSLHLHRLYVELDAMSTKISVKVNDESISALSPGDKGRCLDIRRGNLKKL